MPDDDPAPRGPNAVAAPVNYDRGRNLRLLTLFSVLGLLLLALWYDYQVARPAVDAAYENVTDLNVKINATAAVPPMTSQDVRKELQMQPAFVFKEGPYQVEVYSWVAGLPFRTHDYYAVYTGRGNNLTFMMHFKFALPLDELVRDMRGDSMAKVAAAPRGALE